PRGPMLETGPDRTKGPSGNKCAILAADASRRAALLVAFIRPVCALLAPCRAGASTPIDSALISVRTLTHGSLGLARLADPRQPAHRRQRLLRLWRGVRGRRRPFDARRRRGQ